MYGHVIIARLTTQFSYTTTVLNYVASTISTFIEPDSGVLSVYEDGSITCLDSVPETAVSWSTTATAADLSSTNDLVLSAISVSELFLNSVDSGYCGEYTCTFNNTGKSAAVTITVGELHAS